jgi:hypothetical protein
VRVCYKGYCQRIASQSHGEESVRQLILAARTQTNRHLSLSYTESTHTVSPHASHTLHPSTHLHTKVYLTQHCTYILYEPSKKNVKHRFFGDNAVVVLVLLLCCVFTPATA